MIKLNGNFYLKYEEVEEQIDIVRARFRTSQRSILPSRVLYLDKEFVDSINEEAKNLILSLFYLYGYQEKHTSTKKIINGVSARFKNNEMCTEKIHFMQYDLTTSQRTQYRTQYQNFLINIFLGECIEKFKSLC